MIAKAKLWSARAKHPTIKYLHEKDSWIIKNLSVKTAKEHTCKLLVLVLVVVVLLLLVLVLLPLLLLLLLVLLQLVLVLLVLMQLLALVCRVIY